MESSLHLFFYYGGLAVHILPWIGLVEGTQHFRNVSCHDVLTTETIASFRIDENLNFLNAHVLKGYIITELSHNPQIQHVVINCSSISNIDLSAVEMLEDLNRELLQLGIQLHLSEVKSPVMDRLNSSRLINMLSGKNFYPTIRPYKHFHLKS